MSVSRLTIAIFSVLCVCMTACGGGSEPLPKPIASADGSTQPAANGPIGDGTNRGANDISATSQADYLARSEQALMTLNRQDTELRLDAIAELDQLDQDFAVPLLSDLLYDPDADVRHEAVEALGRSRGDAAVWALASQLGSLEFELRSAVIDALIEHGGYSAIEALVIASTDSDPELARAAELGLDELRSEPTAL